MATGFYSTIFVQTNLNVHFVAGVKMPVKLFIGNLAEHAQENELSKLFEQYGQVNECAVKVKYGFVVSINTHSFMNRKLIILSWSIL